MLKHYVTLFYHGAAFSENIDKEIETRENFRIPKDCYGWYYYDIDIIVEFGVIYKSEPLNKSLRYFIGKELDLDKAIKLFGIDSILVQNMLSNNWNRVLKTKYHAYVLNDTDIVLNESEVNYEG